MIKDTIVFLLDDRAEIGGIIYMVTIYPKKRTGPDKRHVPERRVTKDSRFEPERRALIKRWNYNEPERRALKFRRSDTNRRTIR